MCGRYTQTHPADDLVSEFDVSIEDAQRSVLVPRFNIAPTQEVPIVLERKTRALRFVRWGLVPSFAPSPREAPLLINARAESLAKKPSFRAALATQRCLVIADGFYEWKRSERGKIPHFIRLRSGAPFAFAGLWDVWRGRGGEVLPSCVIVTVPPNDLVAQIHDRMPAILSKEDYSSWISPALAEPRELLRMLRAPPGEALEAWPVSTRVNAVVNDDRACIEPVASPAGRAPFGGD